MSRSHSPDRAAPGGKAASPASPNFPPRPRPFPLLPLERSFLGAAAAAAPPAAAVAAAAAAAAAQAPFSCSSPLLLVRLLFFPLLFFWLGIVRDSDVGVVLDLYQRLLSALPDISVDSISAAGCGVLLFFGVLLMQ